MIIIFDVDGTLIGGEEQDWPSFDRALEKEFGFTPDKSFWDGVHEVTASSIVRTAAEYAEERFEKASVERVKSYYLANLREVAPYKGEIFNPKPGAQEILETLKRTKIFKVGIATGDFEETIRFKLGSASLDISGLPFSSSSEKDRRADIIRATAEKANEPVEDAIYVGDGLWDLRATQELGVPFVATGRNLDALIDAGAEHVARDLHPETILPLISRIISL